MISSFSKSRHFVGDPGQSRLASNNLTLSPTYILRNILSGNYHLLFFVEIKICFPRYDEWSFSPFVLPWQSTYIVLNSIMPLGAFAVPQFQEKICTYLDPTIIKA
jgi:hypothetical protein